MMKMYFISLGYNFTTCYHGVLAYEKTVCAFLSVYTDVSYCV